MSSASKQKGAQTFIVCFLGIHSQQKILSPASMLKRITRALIVEAVVSV